MIPYKLLKMFKTKLGGALVWSKVSLSMAGGFGTALLLNLIHSVIL